MKTAAPAKATSKTTKPKSAPKRAAVPPLDDPKSKAKAKAKAKTTAKKPTPAKAKPATQPRRYHAGVVLKKYGIDGGITPAMVAEVNARFGVTNDRESRAILRNSVHLLRGYLDAGKSTKK